MAKNKFDHIIKNKIISHGTKSSADWTRMEALIDKHLHGSDHQIFEQIITQKLAAATQIHTTPQWDKMEARLDAQVSLDTKKFDQIISQKTKTLPIGISNWTEFLTLLEEWELLHRNIITSRIVEAFVLILVLLLSYQEIKYKDNDQASDQRLTEVLSNPPEELQISDIPIFTPSTADDRVADQSSKTVHPGLKASAFYKKKQHKEQHSATPGDFAKNKPRDFRFDRTATEHKKSDRTALPPLHVVSFRKKIVASKALAKNQNKRRPDGKRTLTIPIETLPNQIGYLDIMSAWTSKKTIQPIAKLRTVSDYFENGWTLGLHLSWIEHFISSPSNPSFNVSAYKRYSRGYGFGLRFNRKIGKWSLSSGFGYQYLNYTPQNVTVVLGSILHQGYRRFRHTGTTLHIAQLPISLSLDVKQTAHTRWYATIGLSSQVVVSSKYLLENIPDPELRNEPKPAPLNFEPFSSYTTLNNFSKGTLDGGALYLNSFSTAQIGIGMDYAINPDHAIFMNLSYHHPITSRRLGPNNDRFYSTYLSMGYKFKINK